MLRLRFLLLLVLALGHFAVVGSRQVVAADHPGKQIYLQQCAHCHGEQGEGVRDEYAQPLIGDRSLLDLKRLIAKTMPKDDVGNCTGENADQVAAYIYDAFYSPAAQVRNRPPRIDLARLTV